MDQPTKVGEVLASPSKTPEPFSPTPSSQHPNVTAAYLALANIWPREFAKQHGSSDTAGVWYHALAGLSTERIKAGIVEISQSDERWPPSPGQFRHICIKAYRRPDPVAEHYTPPDTPKDIARRTCHAALHERITNHPVLHDMPEFVTYDGDFDVLYVVNSVTIDFDEYNRTLGKGVNQMIQFVEPIYAEMRRLFEIEWTKTEVTF